jgi:ABC-2 type transport system ATP-binding protein
MDIVNARKIREFIKEKGKEGKHTIMLTSHILSDIEQTCERIVIINRGRIAYDGSIRNLTRTDGLKKQVRVVLSGAWSRDEVDKLGAIKEVHGDEVLLEVNPAETAAVVSSLIASCPVKDINVGDQSLEQVIESLYSKDAAEQGSERGSVT